MNKEIGLDEYALEHAKIAWHYKSNRKKSYEELTVGDKAAIAGVITPVIIAYLAALEGRE